MASSQPLLAFELQGHRGARGLMPENTLPGFATALSIGVTALEFDVGLTADGIVVVSHDRQLNPSIVRTSDGGWLASTGPALRDLTLAQLRRYDVGRILPDTKYHRRFPEQAHIDGTRIPTLEEVIDLTERAGNTSVGFIIEIKVSPEEPGVTASPASMSDAVVAILAKRQIRARAVIKCFDWSVLQRTQHIAPDITTAYLSVQQEWFDNIGEDGEPSPWTAGFDIGAYGGSVARMVKAAGGAIWSLYYKELDQAKVDEAHMLGLKVIVWTVNEPSDMRALIDLGVDGIITDYPDRLRQVMQTGGMRVPESTPVQP